MRTVIAALIVLAIACGVLPVQATTLPPTLQHGVDWLSAQVRADGSLTGENASLAMPLQTREETALTLAWLAQVPSSLVSAVASNTDGNVEYTARRILAAADMGQARSADVSALLAMQNADGGWGLSATYQSNPLDTAFALVALKAANSSATAAVGAAVGYLSQVQLADGGWGVLDRSSVYITANVLLAANSWSSQYALGSVTSGARDWLLAQRSATQTYSSVLDNALALRALATQTSQSLIIQPIADALNSAQQADGSWAEDPYLTALSLNALWFVEQPASTPTTGDVQGKVIDQSTAAPIEDATVQLVESSASMATKADGSFAFAGVVPGNYALRVSKLGYQTEDVNIQVSVGQVLNLGTIQLVPARLTASVSGVIKNNSGQLLQNVTVSVGTASTLTGATGAYQLDDLPPGAATITATLANYQTATTNVTFVAGTSYLFSPTMYPNNVTPPPTSLQGIVVDSATQTPIVGASAVLNGTTVITDASGKFAFSNLNSGDFSLAISATGYQNVIASGTLVAGVNDVGKIALSPRAQTSTLDGVVTDADTRAPIAGAIVAVQGQSVAATTDATGAYSISGIAGTSFALNVSAAGYLSQSFSVTLTQVGAGTFDIQLTKPTASGISFDDVGMEETPYTANSVAELEVHIVNATTNAASLIVAAQVLDAQNNVAFEFQANAKGFGQDPPNLPVIVPANGGLGIKMTQGMLRQAAGHYSVHVLAIDPSGKVVAEGDTQFDVSASAILAGGLIPDPPLAQIGTNQPIALSADLTNVGNLPINAGNLNLTIVLQNADTQSSTATQTSVQTFTSGAPMNNARGLVGDGAGNFFTINYNDHKVIEVDASGTARVFATLPQGIGIPALGRDAQGNLWIGGSSSSGKVFEVSPQGDISTISLASLGSIAGIDSDANGDLLFTGSGAGEQRLVRRDTQAQETVLWRNGLSTPEDMTKDDAGNYVVTNYGDNSLSKISAITGAITPLASGLNRPFGVTRDAQGNYYVANNGDSTIAKVTSDGQISTYATGLNQPIDLKFDANGNLFVSNLGDDGISKILPDGTVRPFARGVANRPEGMKYDALGNLWIANDDGTLRKKDAQDVASVEAAGLSSPKGLAIDASGDVLVANYSNGVVTKFDGTATDAFASGLSNPYGVAIDAADKVYVTERGADRISYFDATGNKLGVVESFLHSPDQTRVGPNGEIYVRNYNFISVVENGVARKLIDNFNATYIAPDPVNGGLVATTGYDVYHIANDGTSTHINTTRLPFYSYGIGVAADGGIVLDDYSNMRLQKLDAGGTLSIFATLPNYSQTLITDLAGNVYIRLNSGQFYAIDGAGAATQIPVTLNEYMYGFGSSADGQLLTWTNYGRVYAIDPVTGVATLLMSNPGNTSGITRDASGNLYISDNPDQQLRRYDSTGAPISTLDGFTSPWDIVWTGSELRFVDSGNRFYSLAPGAYPVKLGTFAANYLTVANSEVYGSAGATGIIHWNGTTQETWKSVSGATLNGGIAAQDDGTLSAADNAASGVVTLDTSKNIVSNFVGIVHPYGLTFDAQGRLYVANYGANTIARFDTDGKVPALFAKVSNPRHLTFDDTGNLWVSYSGGVDKIDAAGTVELVSNKLVANGLLIDSDQAFALDGNNGQLRKLDGQDWDVVATGLSTPQGVHVGANGDIYVANHGNGTVVKYANGTLSTIASALPGVGIVNYFADGNVYAAGDSGLLYQIEPDGTQTSLNVAKAVSSLPFYGIAPGSSDTAFYGLTGSDNIVAITQTQATAPPPPGTVVYEASVPMAAMAAADGYTHFDLGAWLPPYGGDFRIDVSRADIQGGAANFVHVGPAATESCLHWNRACPPETRLSRCVCP